MLMTRQIPKQYSRFYTQKQHKIRDIREKLRDELSKRVGVSKLEEEVIATAIAEIARRGIKIESTFDYNIYRKDIRKMRAGERRVYLFVDASGNLQDMNPLLRYVSSELRSTYERARETYLGSD